MAASPRLPSPDSRLQTPSSRLRPWPRDSARQGRTPGGGRRAGGDLAGDPGIHLGRPDSGGDQHRGETVLASCAGGAGRFHRHLSQPRPLQPQRLLPLGGEPVRPGALRPGGDSVGQVRAGRRRPDLLQRARADERPGRGARQSRTTASRRATARSRSTRSRRASTSSTPGTSGRPRRAATSRSRSEGSRASSSSSMPAATSSSPTSTSSAGPIRSRGGGTDVRLPLGTKIFLGTALVVTLVLGAACW